MRYQIESELFKSVLHGNLVEDGVAMVDGPRLHIVADEDKTGVYYALLDGKRIPFVAQTNKSGEIIVAMRGYNYRLRVRNERDLFLQSLLKQTARSAGGTVTVKSPMPGLIKSVDVEQGAVVKKGARLLVLEAMKMENDIAAPVDGSITKLQVEAGKAVEKNQVLCVITPPKAES